MRKILGICIIVLFFGCKKEKKSEEPTLPVLTTSAVININGSSATSGGNITSDGGASVTSRGVCWGLTNNPTILDSCTSDGAGTGSFSSEMPNLIQRTNYYVRAYAQNSAGVAYGNSVLFTTAPYFTVGNYHFISQFIYDAKISVGDTIVYKVIRADSTIIYDCCNYKCTGKLMSDPANNIIVDGIWYKFLRISGLYPSLYFVVQQKDDQSIIIKSSTVDYISAYQTGAANVFTRY